MVTGYQGRVTERLQLHAVVIDVPVDEVTHTLLDRRAGSIADVRGEILDVGPGVRHVTELQRQEILFRLAPETLLEHLDVAHELDWLLVADVVQPVRRLARARIRCIAVPVRVRRRYVIAGAY